MSVDYSVHLWRWVGSAPWLIVVMVGAALCLLHARQKPRAATLVGIALAIELGAFFVMPFVSQFLFAAFDATAMHELSWRILLNSVLYSIPNSIALGLLLWAAFGGEARRDGPWTDDAVGPHL
jgi:hypothetical protein